MDPEYQEVFGDYEVPEDGTGNEADAQDEGNQAGAEAMEHHAEGGQGETEEPGAGEQEPGSGEAEDGEQEAPKEKPEDKPDDAAETELAEKSEQARQAAFDRAAQARVDKIYADMFANQANPFTGRPITNEAEYLAFKAAQVQKAQEDALKESGIQPDVIAQMVDSRVAQHPAIAAAQQAAAAARAQQAQAAEAAANEAIRAELAKISAIDPSVKTLEDIGKMPTADAFNRYVRQGVPLEDAFWLAKRKDIEQKRLAAAKQTAINQARSKQGLDSGAGSGGAGVSVPAEQAAEYRAFMPNATDDEIAKAWAKFQKSCT